MEDKKLENIHKNNKILRENVDNNYLNSKEENILIGLEQGSFEEFYRAFAKIPSPNKTKIDVLRMGMFDVVTRQMDRNYTNFSFYKSNGIYINEGKGGCRNVRGSGFLRGSIPFEGTGL